MRCFIAIDVDSQDVRNKIVEIQKDFELGGISLVSPQNLHITLNFLGDITEDDIKKIDHILQRIDYQNFKMPIASVGAFPNIESPRVIWVGTKKPEKIATLANIIQRDLVSAGFPKPDKEFDSPHITIARVKNSPSGINEALEKHKEAVFGSQHFKQFCLKQSTLSPEGPVYTDIKKYMMV